jgi:hypothetical protein
VLDLGGVAKGVLPSHSLLSTAPQTREPRRFKLVLASCAKLGRFLGPPSAGWFLATFPPPNTQKNLLTRGPILAPRPLTPEMDFPRSLAVMAHSICGTLSPFTHRPRFLTCPPSLSLGVYFLSSRTRAFNHERNIVAILHCLSSSALDGSHEPRRDVGRTGEISKDWLAPTES